MDHKRLCVEISHTICTYLVLQLATSDDLIMLIKIVNILRTINLVYDQEHPLLLTMAIFSYSVMKTLCESLEIGKIGLEFFDMWC